MTDAELYLLKYPVGEFVSPASFLPEQLSRYIETIAKFPAKLRLEVVELNDSQLDTPYRPEGWTIRQVVHHVADSHMNSYIRFKLTVTETQPVIKPYLEEKWAETTDGKSAPLWMSLNLLDALHARWTLFLKSLSPTELEQQYHHPQNNKLFSLKEALALYAWHCDHHLAHITNLKQLKNW